MLNFRVCKERYSNHAVGKADKADAALSTEYGFQLKYEHVTREKQWRRDLMNGCQENSNIFS